MTIKDHLLDFKICLDSVLNSPPLRISMRGIPSYIYSAFFPVGNSLSQSKHRHYICNLIEIVIPSDYFSDRKWESKKKFKMGDKKEKGQLDSHLVI